MPKMMHSILPRPPILGYWTIILGTLEVQDNENTNDNIQLNLMLFEKKSPVRLVGLEFNAEFLKARDRKTYSPKQAKHWNFSFPDLPKTPNQGMFFKSYTDSSYDLRKIPELRGVGRSGFSLLKAPHVLDKQQAIAWKLV